ncbi:MAG: hypothetical protein QW589_02115 [Candidatus Bathyarchaeia archaeon]
MKLHKIVLKTLIVKSPLIAKIIKEKIEKIKGSLKNYDIEESRLIFLPTLLPTFRILPEQLTSFTMKIRALGKLNEKAHEEILKQIFSH